MIQKIIKPVVFSSAASQFVRAFSRDLRMSLGEALYLLQTGETLSMPLSRPMPAVARGVHELRLKDEEGIYRVFYAVKQGEALLVFHAFTKKTQKTPPQEIELARRRLQLLMQDERVRTQF